MNASGLVLIAEDNPEDAILLRHAFQKAGVTARSKFVVDGEEVLSYLQGLPPFEDRSLNPLPAMILLDIKMPRKTGLEVLEWLTENREYAVVPTVIMSSSSLENDIRRAYHLGVNTYFVKPHSFDELVNTLRALETYWGKAQKVRPLSIGSTSLSLF